MNSHSILVIDDDPAILDLIAQILIDEGYVALTAGEGRAGALMAMAYLPALILLDLMMPDMSGWQVIAELQATGQTCDIPVVLLSARRDLRTTASELGAAAYIEKPFDLDELLHVVQRFVDIPQQQDQAA